MTVDTVAAGEDADVEKPVAHDLAEGDRLVKAVEATGQVVATGTQQRSWKDFIEPKQLIHEGVLEEITLVRCHWSQIYSPLRPSRKAEIDMNKLHWVQWLRASAKQPFHKPPQSHRPDCLDHTRLELLGIRHET